MAALSWSDWLQLFLHFMLLSLMSIGGAITTAPEMHRYLVDQHRWLSDAQFNASISIAQAAPGPNILFVALMGWNVGVNTGYMAAALIGLLMTMCGILLPSTIITCATARWGHRNRNVRIVRAFRQGMAPLVIALMLGTGWVMISAHSDPGTSWPLWLTSAVTALVVWRTRIHLLWLLGAGALLGWFGFI